MPNVMIISDSLLFYSDLLIWSIRRQQSKDIPIYWDQTFLITHYTIKLNKLLPLKYCRLQTHNQSTFRKTSHSDADPRVRTLFTLNAFIVRDDKSNTNMFNSSANWAFENPVAEGLCWSQSTAAISLPARGPSFHSSPQHWPSMLLSALLSNSSQMQSSSVLRTPQRLSVGAPAAQRAHSERRKNRKQPHNVLPQAACFDLASATCSGHETCGELLRFYHPADNFRERKEGEETPCFHWGWKIMRPLFSSSCYKLKAVRTSTWPIKQLKNEQSRKILRGMFHISQGEGCHLLCK